MPQQGGSGSKKKKKGGGRRRAPAHQNAFAFQHNPKSKLTEKILNSPNIHVCRRCHEKIEWRKQYRKYKPLTQPSNCNLCGKRNVMAAYHTICADCTTSDKAKAKVVGAAQTGDAATTSTTDNTSTASHAESSKAVEDTDETPPSEAAADGESCTAQEQPLHRVCAVCVKEPALPDEHDEATTVDSLLANETGRIRLRDRRALERKLARQQQEEEAKKRNEQEARRAAAKGEDDVDQEVNGNYIENDGTDKAEVEEESNNTQALEEQEEDPFLKAVGGADKLLTGEAYQAMLLEREQRKLS